MASENQRESKAAAAPHRGRAVIQITAENKPGVMAHICGLFAKRGFNLEGIASLPVAGGARSRIWLALEDDRRLEPMVKLIQKMRNVIDVELQNAEREIFSKLEDFFQKHPEERPPELANRNGA